MRTGITAAVKREVVDGAEKPLSADEFQAKWAKFSTFMERTPDKSTKRVKGRVTRVFGPVPIAQMFQGTGKVRDNFLLDCVVTHKGMEGLTFNKVEVANSLDERAKWNHLYTAATGEVPSGAEMTVHPAIVCTRDVWLVVKKDGKRPDNKYGGFYFKVVEFQAAEDEDGNLGPATDLRDEDWVEPTVEQWQEYADLAQESMATGKRVYRKGGSGGGYRPAGLSERTAPQAIVQPAQRPLVEDDVPFDDEDEDEA